MPIGSGTGAGSTRCGPAGPAGIRGTVGTFYYFAIKAFDEWGNAGPISNLASGTTLAPPTGGVAPTSVSADLFTGQTADRQVTLSNLGVGTLDFAVDLLRRVRLGAVH